MGIEVKLDNTFFERKNVGIIGCGIRGSNLLDELNKLDMNTKITAVCDPKAERAIAELKEMNIDTSEIKVWEDADEMLDKAGLDGVIVATRSEVHVHYALKVLARNIPMILEKPITYSMDELIQLRDAYEKSEKKVLISFPLRNTPIVDTAKEIIDSGRIGTPEHIQAVNFVPYGGVYFHNWYRCSGPAGLFFEKSTHDFDWMNRLAGVKPKELVVMTSHRVFGGDMPAGKMCRDCDKQLTCMESPFMQKNFAFDNPNGKYCSYSEDVSTYDSAGVLIRYETGMHANYSENHFARKGAGRRGATITGYSGTLNFDFYTGEIKVYRHHSPVVETYQIQKGMSHFGGDHALMYNFVRMMSGDTTVAPTMEEGFISTIMCMSARDSIEKKSFTPIVWGDGRKI